MPITWKNVATPSFTGASASMAGAATSFKNAGEALTAAFKGPLEDRRKAAEDARLEAAGARQQEAHALAQQLGKYEIDAAAFDVATQQEMFDVNKAAKNRQYTAASGSKAKPTKEQFLHMQRQTPEYRAAVGLYEKHGGDRNLVQQEGMTLGITPNLLGLAASDLDQVKFGTESIQKAKLSANKAKSGSGSIMSAPKNLFPDAWDLDSKATIKVGWEVKAQQLRDMGFDNGQIATIMKKGYGSWQGWDEARAGLLKAQKDTKPNKNY